MSDADTLQKRMNDEFENPDSLNGEGEDVTPISNDTPDDYSYEEPAEDVDTLKEQLAKKDEQNRQLYARLKKQEKKEPAKAPETPKPEPALAPVSNDTEELKQKLTKLELRELGFKTQEEQEIVLNAAKLGGLTLEQAAENKFVKAQIEEMREERRVQDATPPPSGRGGTRDTNSVDYYIRTGEIPEDDELADKVDAERIRRTKEQI